MISSSQSRVIARRVLTNGRVVARPAPRPRVRFNSSTAGPSSSTSASSNSHLMAGVAGGAAVLLGGYGYYHFSGIKSVVDASKSMQQTLTSAKNTIAEKTPAPGEALAYLRSVAKSYVVFVPGAASYVDASFDTLDELQRTRGEEVNDIVQRTYDDIKKATSKGQMDVKTATEVLSILQRQGAQLLELANQAGQDIIGPILDKHPEVKEKLGGGWEEIQRVTRDAGNSEVASQAKKVADDTMRRLSEIFQAGFSPEAVAKAKDLVETKSKEIKQLVEKAGKEAWEKGSKEYQKYVDKAPEDVKKLLSPDGDSIKALLSGSGGFAAATAVWAKVKDIGSSKAGFDEKSVKELKDLVEEKVKHAKDAASSSGFQSINLDSVWKSAQGWLKSVPGGQKALDQVQDIDVSALSKVVQSRSDDAQKLAQETYSEILQVLKDKSEKAKKLGKETKDEAKKEAKK